MKGKEFYFKTRDGLVLYGRASSFDKERTIVALHGIAEHLSRHQYLNELFAEDFNLIQFDLRGHGRSEGRRGDIEDFSLFLDDLEDLLVYLQKEKGIKHYSIFAHSMGALIVWGFLQRKSPLPFPERVFLSAPSVSVPGKWGMLIPRFFVKTVLDLPLKFWLPKPFKNSILTHDLSEIKKLERDKLCLKLFSKRLIFGLVKSSQDFFNQAIEPPCPVGVAVGEQDKIVSPEKIRKYFLKCGSRVQLKIVEGSYHEIHNELDKFRLPYFDYLRKFFS